MTYTLTAQPHIVIRDEDGAFIPDDLANRDWQAYQKWLSAGNTPNPVPALPLTTQAAHYLAGGLTITSGNSALDGTYSVTPPNNHTINAIITSIANGTGLPLGLSQVAIFDMSGAQHLFDTQEVSDFAVVFRDFVQGVYLYVAGQAPSLPPNSVHLESETLPVNVTAPVVTQSGGELNCSQGDWTGVPKSIDYQCRMDRTQSVGTDSSTYVLTVPDDVGHEFNCIVTASNVLGSAQASSNAVTAATPSGVSTQKETEHGDPSGKAHDKHAAEGKPAARRTGHDRHPNHPSAPSTGREGPRR